MIKAIVFDFNGIFVIPREMQVLERLCSIYGTGKWVALSNYYVFLWRFQRGELSPFEFWKKVFVDLNERDFNEHVEGLYNEPFAKNEAMYSLASQLSERFPLYCLSNSNFTQGKTYRKQGLYNPFKGFFLSHEMHAMKPFPEIFGMFLKKTGLKAGECLFIDDSPINALAALALGFKVIIYTDAKRLEEKLRQLKLL